MIIIPAPESTPHYISSFYPTVKWLLSWHVTLWWARPRYGVVLLPSVGFVMATNAVTVNGVLGRHAVWILRAWVEVDRTSSLV
jgi:hypothetical protein